MPMLANFMRVRLMASYASLLGISSPFEAAIATFALNFGG